MKLKSSIGILVTAAILSAAPSVAAQPGTASAAPKSTASYKPGTFQTITRAEVETLVTDAATASPQILKLFAEDPEMKKTQLQNLRELFSLAAEAERVGLAATALNRQELVNIRIEVTAVNYDRHITKDKTAAPSFAAIGSDRITQFWASDTSGREAAFQVFLDTKVQLLNADNPATKNQEITEAEKAQARDIFAKMKIYEKEYTDKAAAGTLPKTFRDKVDLQIKLQQAQFLARAFSKSMAAATAVSDQDIKTYIAAHPEFDIATKKARAETILQRARAGEDFAKLANEFSEDPGNRKSEGGFHGGLYEDVPKGRMIAAFEQGALELKPGEVAGRLVETEYGYHIIKLEKAPGVAPAAETYDVRHILIATTFKDPNDPAAREVPVTTFVRTKLAGEKESRLLKEIVTRNKVSVPDDFTVPGTKPVKAAAEKSSVPVKKTPPAARRKRRTPTRRG